MKNIVTFKNKLLNLSGELFLSKDFNKEEYVNQAIKLLAIFLIKKGKKESEYAVTGIS